MQGPAQLESVTSLEELEGTTRYVGGSTDNTQDDGGALTLLIKGKRVSQREREMGDPTRALSLHDPIAKRTAQNART